jgi:hypothetical protein
LQQSILRHTILFQVCIPLRVPKRLWQASRPSLSHDNEKSKNRHIFGKESINAAIFHLQLKQYIYNTRSGLMSSEFFYFFFMNSQFTKMLKITSTWIITKWKRHTVDCRTPWRAPSRFRTVKKKKKTSRWNICSFLIRSEYTVVFEGPHRQKFELLGSREIGSCTSNNKFWRTYIHMGIFLAMV